METPEKNAERCQSGSGSGFQSGERRGTRRPEDQEAFGRTDGNIDRNGLWQSVWLRQHGPWSQDRIEIVGGQALAADLMRRMRGIVTPQMFEAMRQRRNLRQKQKQNDQCAAEKTHARI
jgi:hypothetical protein